MVETRAGSITTAKRARSDTSDGPPAKQAKVAASKTGFLDLPQEVRDHIYTLCLVKDSGSVFAVRTVYDADGKSQRLGGSRKYDPKAGHDSVQGLCMTLFLVNRQIGSEAAYIFYNRNQFALWGQEIDYTRMSDWLDQIGSRNRKALRLISVAIRELSLAWQFKDGRREGYPDDWISSEVWPRIPMLRCPNVAEDGTEHWEEGAVDAIDPRLERLFEILGRDERQGSSKLLLEFTYMRNTCDFNYWNEDDDCQTAEFFWISMDLPNVVEKWRELHTTGGREVEVHWKLGSIWPDIKEHFEDMGFEIVEMTDHESEDNYDPIRDNRYTFTLHRRLIEGDPIASPTNRWGMAAPDHLDI